MQQFLEQAVQPASAGTCATYERRRPEETVLYQLIAEHLETFFAQVEAETGAGLPDFVKKRSLRPFSNAASYPMAFCECSYFVDG